MSDVAGQCANPMAYKKIGWRVTIVIFNDGKWLNKYSGQALSTGEYWLIVIFKWWMMIVETEYGVGDLTIQKWGFDKWQDIFEELTFQQTWKWYPSPKWGEKKIRVESNICFLVTQLWPITQLPKCWRTARPESYCIWWTRLFLYRWVQGSQYWRTNQLWPPITSEAFFFRGRSRCATPKNSTFLGFPLVSILDL